VDTPVTLIVVPIKHAFAIPRPPPTINAPLVDKVESVVLETVVIPETFNVLLRVETPLTFKVVPIKHALAIPRPPLTINAPLIDEVESVILETVAIPLTFKVVPIKHALEIPRPPLTTNAPLVDKLESIVFETVVIPETFKVLLNVDAPVTFKVVPIKHALEIPRPPLTTNAPLVDKVESVVLETAVIPETFKELLSVDAPVTFKVVPIKHALAIPRPPLTTNAPLVDKVESVVFETVVIPEIFKVLLRMDAPVTFKVVPIKHFLAIPRPPLTINAPLIDEVESVVFETVVIPVRVDAPPTLNVVPIKHALAIPIPPLTINAPLVDKVESVVFETVVIPETFKELLRVETPPTLKVVPIKHALAIPRPPLTTNAPLVDRVESVVLETVVIPETFKVLETVVIPETFNVLLRVDAPPTLKVVPIKHALAIPRPPLTINAPLIDEVESVVFETVVIPETFKIL
jgi:hypothetical protein